MASASTPRGTLAGELHGFGNVEWSEVAHPATNTYWTGAPASLHHQFLGHPATNNIYWTGAPTSLHNQFFGPQAFMAPPAFMGSMGALQIQYVGRPGSIFIQIAGRQRAFYHDHDEGSVDARGRIVEYDDESDEAGAGDRTEQGDIDDGFPSGEEESEFEDDIADVISTGTARTPRPESEDDELLEEAGDDESGVFNGTNSTESESERNDADDDADSGESESDGSDSDGASEDSNSGSGESDGDEDDCRDELETEDAQEQDASGEDDEDESGDENDQWVTPNSLKRARTPDSGDEEDEPPHKTSRVLIVKSFEGNVLGAVFHNGIRIHLG
ncbi:hypothetical protein EYR36_009182 [Pleurotus pulmonarius]|nr:hypothetical protein EYR36_009182 [Pleurotus pulmonarius]KAF4592677.1 hypothetical protein EYR38_008376 [Pleurotus pulmonarius]